MNWSKAKTILIIVFLIADIFLFYELYSGALGSRLIMDKENTKEVIKYLEKQGISVKSSIPKPSSSRATLTVKYKYFDKQYALENFFDSPDVVAIHTQDDRIVMEDEKIYVEINKNGEFIYTNKALMQDGEAPFDEKQALNKIEAFLKKIGIGEKDRYNESKTIEKGYLGIYFSQAYKDTFLDKSYLEIQATNKGVIYIKMLWFETVNNGKAKKEIIPPIKALMKLSELYKDSEHNVTVSDIGLGYYFNTDLEQVKELDVKAVEEGTAILVWRVKTDMGDIYINAYNGIVEKK